MRNTITIAAKQLYKGKNNTIEIFWANPFFFKKQKYKNLFNKKFAQIKQ